MGMLADRIGKNAKHLRKWARRQGFTCLRLYDHDIPEYALSLEDYEGHVLVTLSSAAPERWTPEQLESEIRSVLECKELVFKQRGVRPGGTRQSGDSLDLRQAFLVDEQGMKFEVNLHGYQDSGLFLDHRLTRAWVRARATGRRVLNLFCYTGSFSVAAAMGGAATVTSIDLSNTYLQWAARNFAHNELEPQRLLQADVMQWLPAAQGEGEQYDLIVCDPPTFSNSKRMQEVFDVQARHADMLRGLQILLASGGTLLFSCNDSRFKLDASLSGFEEITQQTRSEDFRRRGGHRCWRYQS